MSPEELDEARAVGANAALDRVDLGKGGITINSFFVSSHVKRQGILLAVIPLEHSANGMRIKAKLVSLRIVGTMSH